MIETWSWAPWLGEFGHPGHRLKGLLLLFETKLQLIRHSQEQGVVILAELLDDLLGKACPSAGDSRTFGLRWFRRSRLISQGAERVHTHVAIAVNLLQCHAM